MPTRAFGLLLLGLALLFAVGCGGSDSKGGLLSGLKESQNDDLQGRPPRDPGAPSQGGSSATTGGGNEALTALRNMASSKTLRGQFSSEFKPITRNDTGDKQEGTFEQAGQNLRFKIVGGKGVQDGWEMVRVGGKPYTFMKAMGAWYQESDAIGGTLLQLFEPAEIFKNWQGSKLTTSKAGTETVAGKSCQVYVQDDKANKTKFDVCVADGVAIRYRSVGPNNSYTLTITEINANFEIKVPDKVAR